MNSELLKILTTDGLMGASITGADAREIVALANRAERLEAALLGLVSKAQMEEFESVEAHIANDEEWDLTVTAGALREAIDALAALAEPVEVTR